MLLPLYLLIVPLDEASETALDPGLEKPVQRVRPTPVHLHLTEHVELHPAVSCKCLDLFVTSRLLQEEGLRFISAPFI